MVVSLPDTGIETSESLMEKLPESESVTLSRISELPVLLKFMLPIMPVMLLAVSAASWLGTCDHEMFVGRISVALSSW